MKNNSTLYLCSTPSSNPHFNKFLFIISAKKTSIYVYIYTHVYTCINTFDSSQYVYIIPLLSTARNPEHYI